MDSGADSYRRYLAGEDEGMVELIRDYRDGLTLYLNTFAGDILTAEDWMEDVFVKLATRKPRFRGNSSFRTWLYAIGRNVALDAIRRQKARREVPYGELPDRADEEADLERRFLREERKIAVHRALERLNPDYRQVLYLACFEQLDNGETARVLKKSRRQVENLLSRARKSLRIQLEKEGFVYEEC